MNTGRTVRNITLTAKKWGSSFAASSSTMSTGLLSPINVSEAIYMLKIICTVLGVSASLQVQIELTNLILLTENVRSRKTDRGGSYLLSLYLIASKIMEVNFDNCEVELYDCGNSLQLAALSV